MKLFNIELKNPSAGSISVREGLDILYETLCRFGCIEKTIISTFNFEYAKKVRNIHPEIKTAFLYNNKLPTEESVEMAKRYGASAIHPSWKKIDENIVYECHCNGIEVNAWTADSHEAILYCARLGVDGIISNVPDKAHKLANDGIKLL